MTLYIQRTWKLRWHTMAGQDRTSTRPKKNPNDSQSAYLDVPPNAPTLVEFGPDDRVDVNDLLKMGAIATYEPPPAIDASNVTAVARGQGTTSLEVMDVNSSY